VGSKEELSNRKPPRDPDPPVQSARIFGIIARPGEGRRGRRPQS
jgi:hypothetical protein